MNAFRHGLGVLLVVCLPPAIIYWLVVHPVAKWWRRLDTRITYGILTAFAVGLGVLLYTVRQRLLGRDLGTHWPLIAAGTALYLMAVAVSLLCRRQLTLSILVGAPELSRTAFPGVLLQHGIFGVIRHPRYLSVILGTSASALIVGYLGVYIVVGLSLIGLWPLIVPEEHELASRFGPAYAAYRSRVPALVPRLRRNPIHTQANQGADLAGHKR